MTKVKNRRFFLKTLLFSLFSGISINSKGANSDNATKNDVFTVSDEIEVNGRLDDVFSFITDAHNADKISINIKDLQVVGKQPIYNRKLMVHGFKNQQQVKTEIIKDQYLYFTQTKLFGVKVEHSYQLAIKTKQLVTVSIIKKAEFTTWFDVLMRPFIEHQLTRPEHDGLHLKTLKKASEANL